MASDRHAPRAAGEAAARFKGRAWAHGRTTLRAQIQLIAQQSAYSMLVLVLRMYLARGERGGAGWLFALANPQLARAIASMHETPARDWTVQTLADEVNMSRTTFAEHFRRTVGESPIEYLTRWRMLVAGERLIRSNASVLEIANAVGYDSESAFCAAFNKTTRESPRAYARRRRAQVSA